jgi:hypothetical protein
MSNAVKAEAKNLKNSFTYDSVKYTVPTPDEMDMSVIEDLEQGLVVAALKAVLGPDQWATFKSKPRTAKDLNDLMEKVSGAMRIEGN